MRAILLAAPRHGKSSRGTPRLRRPPRRLHGVPRLAAWTTRSSSWPRFLGCAQDAPPGRTHSLTHPDADLLARSALLRIHLAASGGVIVCLEWPALTPALTEIRLFGLGECRSASGRGTALNWISWLFSSRRQAHFLLAHQTVILLMPNVRAKPAPTAWRAGQQAQNGP